MFVSWVGVFCSVLVLFVWVLAGVGFVWLGFFTWLCKMYIIGKVLWAPEVSGVCCTDVVSCDFCHFCLSDALSHSPVRSK